MLTYCCTFDDKKFNVTVTVEMCDGGQFKFLLKNWVVDLF